jgi:hypothetical protein
MTGWLPPVGCAGVFFLIKNRLAPTIVRALISDWHTNKTKTIINTYL